MAKKFKLWVPCARDGRGGYCWFKNKDGEPVPCKPPKKASGKREG